MPGGIYIRLLIVLGAISVVVGSVTSASGPRFSAMPQAPSRPGKLEIVKRSDDIVNQRRKRDPESALNRHPYQRLRNSRPGGP
jgi:hypothetical protein